jgi:hypothetical protein
LRLLALDAAIAGVKIMIESDEDMNTVEAGAIDATGADPRARSS